MTAFMADSIRPVADIPAAYRTYRNYGAALYGNGGYEAPPGVVAEFPRHIIIGTLTGNAAQGRYCDALDVERWDATADDWPAFRATRDEWCHSTGRNRWPKVYCSIIPDATHGVVAIVDACRRAGQALPQHWWIAWYPGNGRAPSVVDVALEIERLTGETIPVETIWGCQWEAGGLYDKSVIYQTPEWA